MAASSKAVDRNIYKISAGRIFPEREEVVGHETKGMDSMSAFLYTFLEQEIEAIIVRGRKEDVLSPIASGMTW